MCCYNIYHAMVLEIAILQAKEQLSGGMSTEGGGSW